MVKLDDYVSRFAFYVNNEWIMCEDYLRSIHDPELDAQIDRCIYAFAYGVMYVVNHDEFWSEYDDLDDVLEFVRIYRKYIVRPFKLTDGFPIPDFDGLVNIEKL